MRKNGGLPTHGQAEYKKVVSIPEYITYGMYFIGQNLFYGLVATYLMVFFTDIGITAAMVSVIILVVKLWDAINDPIFGGIVDRVKFKNGKFMPWLRLSVILIPISTVLLFAIPSGIRLGAKVVWAILAYMLWDTAYTICDVPIYGIATTLTNNLGERSNLMSVGRLCSMLAGAVLPILVPAIRVAIGGWFPLVVLLSVVGFATTVPFVFVGKEKVRPANSEKEIGLREMFRYIAKNKYLLLINVVLLVNGAFGISYGLGLYFARYNLGNEGMLGTINMVMIVPVGIISLLLPWVLKKVDKYYLLAGSLVANVVFGLLAYFVGYNNFTLLIIFNIFKMIPVAIITFVQFMFTPDCAEYGHYRTGINASGMAFAFQTFNAKLVAAVFTSLGALALVSIGFVEGESAIQAAGFADKLWVAYTLVPLVGSMLALPILGKYKLRNKHVEAMAKCNAGEISRQEAETIINNEI